MHMYMHHEGLSIGFTPSGPLAILETLGMLPIITKGEARGDYRGILKVSTQLEETCLSAITGLDYGIERSVLLYEI